MQDIDTAAHWAAVKACFSSLSDLPTVERPAALAAIGDARVQREVRSLLEAAERVGERFERAPLIDAGPDRLEPLSAGTRVGAWALGRRVGQGGMGAVYEATRDDGAFAKRAAIKMLSIVATRDDVAERFERERATLARLEHRNIATLLDGGVDATGAPWFAMEFVDGERIDQWCASRALGVRQRVALFRQACAAVQYAHERLVVHRDLKPANIMVSADGTVKLLDFGIAKLVDDPDGPRTSTGLAPMTTAYASPEQRAGAPVTTATDIYSLGVVLYELLTGSRPEAGARTGESAPAVPSRRVLSSTTTQGVTAARIDPRRTHQLLRGDLDAIVMMALRPEPERRYASVQALADDLQQWLSGRTVRARPDTVGYRLRTLIRRNPINTATLVCAAMGLLGAAVYSQRQANAARRDRDVARQAQQRAERVTSFLQEVVRRARPRVDGAQVSLVTAIANATPFLDTAFAGDRALQAEVRATVASTLGELGLYAQGRPLLDSALAFYRRRDGATVSREQADALWSLAAYASYDGHVAQSDSILRQLLFIYAGPGYPRNQVLKARAWLAENRASAGHPGEAIPAYDSVLAQFDMRTRDDSLFYATTLSNRGSSQVMVGQFRRGSDDLMRAAALQDRIDPSATSDRASKMQPVAMALLFSGRLVEAESVAREALGIKIRAAGQAARSEDGHARALGAILMAQQQYAAADSVFSMILQDRGSRLPDSDPSIGFALAHRALCRAVRGERASVASEAREAVRLYRRAYARGTPQVNLIESVAGAALGYGPPAQWAEAHALLVAGAEGSARTLDAHHPRVAEARARLTEFERRTGFVNRPEPSSANR